jgi:putative oxidoreductase
MSWGTSRRPVWLRTLALALCTTNDSNRTSDAALLAVRVVLTWIFVYYGAGKLFGLFNGPGIHQTAIFFSTTAHLDPGGLFAVLGGVIEFGGALLLIVGIGSRLASFALIGDQVVAIITVTGKHGINSLSSTPGYEFNLALATLALVVVAYGAGRYSIDALVARRLRMSAISR